MAGSAGFTLLGSNSAAGGDWINTNMAVAGVTGPLAALTVSFRLTHPTLLDLHVLLVGPDGVSNLVLFSRESGASGSVSNEWFVFTDYPQFSVTDHVLAPLDTAHLSNSVFSLPMQLNHAASTGSATLASAFNGIDVNGTWKLYVYDSSTADGGTTFADWTLNFVTNVAPVITAPGTQTVETGHTLKFSAANGNALAIADADANAGDTASLALSVEHGSMTGHGPSFNASGAINLLSSSYLDGLVYTPAAGFTGVDHLTIKLTDQGGANGLGALTTTKVVDIEVFDHPAATSGDDSFTASGWQKIDGGAGKDSIKFNFALTQATVTYDDNKVIIEGPGTKTVLTGFEKFVFNDGTVDNADGSPLVDDLFYYTRNHDVWAAHVDPDKHYAEFGWHEGRNPNAFFNTNGYLATYGDVKAAGVNPLQHYDEFGWKEGRDPSTAFDTGDYFATYADVAAAKVDPLAHFLQFGHQEGRHAFSDGAWG